MKKKDSDDSKPQKHTKEQQLISTRPLDGMVNSADEVWFNIQDLAFYLKMSERSISRLVNQNKIPNVKLGGTLMFPKNLMNNIMLQNALKQMEDKNEEVDNPEA
jgi:hypothetical protein